MGRYVLIFFIALTSCNYNREDNITIDPILLKGNWIAEHDKLSFWDSAVTDPVYFKDYFLSYSINQDTVKIKGKIPDEGVVQYDLKIVKLNSDSLVFYYDTVVFKYGRAKLTKRNVINFQEIQFSSGPCFGSCPVLNIKIQSNGDIFYQGKSFTELTGNYVGKVTQENIKQIRNFLSLYDIDDLKSEIETNHLPDDPGYALYLKLNNNEEIIIKGSGFVDYPELADRLSEFYKFCNLTKSEVEMNFLTEQIMMEL